MLKAPSKRQHFTDKDYLKHSGRTIVNHDYNTIYGSDFEGRPTTEPPTKRRFPRIHKDGDPSLTKLTTTTTAQFREPDVPFRTPLHVLAVSQEPFLAANKWKYSHHGLPKCYPPYDKVGSHRPFPLWAYQSTEAPTKVDT